MSPESQNEGRGAASTVGPPAPGLHHFMRLEGDSPTRFHLRVDPDGAGLLMANAAEAAHLSAVGVLMVHGVLRGQPHEQIVAQVRASFRGGTQSEVEADLERVRELLADLASPEDNYPITNFAGAEAGPDARLGAPFQAHVVQGETANVEPILRALWEVGVPQVTLLAQLGADVRSLVRLVECAEDIGMLAGIRTVASWLSQDIIRDTAMAGLDFLTLVVASHDPDRHDAILGAGDHEAMRRAAALCHDMELCPVAQVPLTDDSADDLEQIVKFALGEDIRNLSFFAVACLDGEEEADAAGALPARSLPQVATVVTECAEEAGARFIWEPPVRFDPRKTLADHIMAGPRASGEASIRVEPDGTVCPPRGKRRACGNMLREDWSQIWNHEAFTRYRESVEAPSRCDVCPGLALCAAACPKDPSGWSDDTENGGAS